MIARNKLCQNQTTMTGNRREYLTQYEVTWTVNFPVVLVEDKGIDYRVLRQGSENFFFDKSVVQLSPFPKSFFLVFFFFCSKYKKKLCSVICFSNTAISRVMLIVHIFYFFLLSGNPGGAQTSIFFHCLHSDTT